MYALCVHLDLFTFSRVAFKSPKIEEWFLITRNDNGDVAPSSSTRLCVSHSFTSRRCPTRSIDHYSSGHRLEIKEAVIVVRTSTRTLVLAVERRFGIY